MDGQAHGQAELPSVDGGEPRMHRDAEGQISTGWRLPRTPATASASHLFLGDDDAARPTRHDEQVASPVIRGPDAFMHLDRVADPSVETHCGGPGVDGVGHRSTIAAWVTLADGMSQPPAAPADAGERLFTGIQPSGASHLGNYLGAQANYVALQDRYEAIYAIVDYHALTTVHDGETLRGLTHEMVLDMLAVGLDPTRCAIVRQSDLPEHAELCWIFDTVVPVSWLERNPTYKAALAEGKENSAGLLNYPVLQAADIVIYKATIVPVGRDQQAHLELSREIVRAFNRRYGEIFAEPRAVHTDASVVLGTDGKRKMGKSAGNTIPIFAEPDEIRRLVMSMVTDPLRIKRTDPGRPEVCNVCQLHRFFGGDYLEIHDGERTARTGCVDTKKLLAERIIEFFRPMRDRRRELAADAAIVEETLAAGAAHVRPLLAATMAEVKAAVGIGPRQKAGA